MQGKAYPKSGPSLTQAFASLSHPPLSSVVVCVCCLTRRFLSCRRCLPPSVPISTHHWPCSFSPNRLAAPVTRKSAAKVCGLHLIHRLEGKLGIFRNSPILIHGLVALMCRSK
ncbi:hypothetical protein L2E82_49900 [Cichorium intybus]|uniref:Uncharacterized protein n=1 Tax=Cichorium intybus TaxID=13427 RepID=A0ACB8Z1G7_CICIN|nr:hypothetical protein L2E82_49900 [Cichorium intybus]